MNGFPLDALRDIHIPPVPAWWPPAPGWWMLLLILLPVSVILGRRLYQRHRRWRQRRRVLLALAALKAAFEDDGNPARFAGELSVLLRQVAMARFPRERVAGLHGLPWLRFLDDSGGQGGFADGPGRVLLSAPYQAEAVVDVPALTALARAWLRRNG